MPSPRGPLTDVLLPALRRAPGPVDDVLEAARDAVSRTTDVLRDDDIQLALFVLYELHYRGVDGVDADWEWAPELLAVRAVLEEAFERSLRAAVPVPAVGGDSAQDIAAGLFALTQADDGPSAAAFIQKRATREQVLEFLTARTIYHLKEADPHSWAIPRLSGRAKSALVEIQSDEYGNGRAGHTHAELFARTLRSAGLDDTYGAYVDRVTPLTLASLNMMSLFGLHRRLRGAIAGHLAAFEMTSSVPSRRISAGMARLGFDEDARAYYDEHVEADAVHEQIAGRDLAGALAETEPELREDVLWGAAACVVVDGMVAAELVEAWSADRSALRQHTRAAA